MLNPRVARALFALFLILPLALSQQSGSRAAFAAPSNAAAQWSGRPSVVAPPSDCFYPYPGYLYCSPMAMRLSVGSPSSTVGPDPCADEPDPNGYDGDDCTPTSVPSVSATIPAPTSTPPVHPTGTGTSVPTPTCSPSNYLGPGLVYCDTATPTSIDTPTGTDTPVPTPTCYPSTTQGPGIVYCDTATPVGTDTPTATDTPTSTDTATDTPTSTDTATDTPTATGTPTGTATSTDTAIDTPTAADTPTATPTTTDTPTATPTTTNTPCTGGATTAATLNARSTRVGAACSPVPILVALGDSVTSGHHQETTGAHLRICDDATYSYPQYLVQRLRKQDKRWMYVNHAHSGFSTWQVIHGGMNACGKGPFNSPPPLARAVSDLSRHLGARNQVVITAGVDDTNWVSVVEGTFIHSRTSRSCLQYVVGTWNYLQRRARIVSNETTIINTLVQADPSVQIYWVGYYNMAGTGGTAHMSTNCTAAIAYGVRAFLNATRAAIHASRYPGNVRLVNVDVLGVMHSNPAHTQPIDLTIGVFPQPNYYVIGWPHPNSAGHQAIANQIP